MDQKDLFAFFLTLKKQYTEDEIPRILEMYEITKLDVNRIYRYLDKYTEKMDPDFISGSGYNSSICSNGGVGGGGGGGGGGGLHGDIDLDTIENN
jgi:uncharacterized membrane protein